MADGHPSRPGENTRQAAGKPGYIPGSTTMRMAWEKLLSPSPRPAHPQMEMIPVYGKDSVGK